MACDLNNAKYTIAYSEDAYKRFYGRKHIACGIVWLCIGFIGFIAGTLLSGVIGDWWTVIMSISFMFILFAAPLSFSMYVIEKKIAKKQKLYVFEDGAVSILMNGEAGVFFTQKDPKSGWIKIFTILKIERIKITRQYLWIYGDILLNYINYGNETVTHVKKIQIPRIYDENTLMIALEPLKGDFFMI